MSSTPTSAIQQASDQEVDLRAIEDSPSAVNPSNGEVLVKSAERVRDLGEVFTPAATVEAILDLLPERAWDPHPAYTFLEPGCGDGNFLVAILQRKLDSITAHFSAQTLPAGQSADAIKFHALEAFASIYAVDISPDNVIGGTPGHEIGARQRLLNQLASWCASWVAQMPDVADCLEPAEWIVERNILVGNLLPFDADGNPSGREDLPIVEYQWDPESLAVTIFQLTLGSVMNTAKADTTGVVPLFSDASEATWSGPAHRLAEAQVPVPSLPKGPVRNGNGSRGG